MSTAALIVAAGSSVRFGGPVPKQFLCISGRPLLSWTISRFESAPSIDKIVVVVAPDYLLYAGDNAIDPFRFDKVHKIVSGGATRQESVLLGLQSLSANTEYVAIHDGARPVVLPEDIEAVAAAAKEGEAAMLAALATDTIKRVEDGVVVATLDRRRLYLAQTPQVFRYQTILAAHQHAIDRQGITDDAMLIEEQGIPVRVVEPSGPNPKVTTANDLVMIQALLEIEIDA